MIEKPSILIVTELYPNVVTSFLGTFVAQLLQYQKARYNVFIITTHNIPVKMRLVLRQPGYRYDDGIHVYSISVPLWCVLFMPSRLLDRVFKWNTQALIRKLITARKIKALARQLHRKHHFVLVHGHETYIGDEAGSVGNYLGIPSVFTLCGVYWNHRRQLGENLMRRSIANINAANRLIALSCVSAESYRKAGVNREFAIVPYGVAVPDAGPKSSVAGDIYSLTRGKFVLLTVGFFVPEKRIEQSIQAIARLHREGFKGIVLLIIGKGPLEQELANLARRENVADFVRIVGEVDPKAMAGFYEVADVLVHPSIVEGLSMVCLEAMSYGKPIVCTSNIGLAEYLHSWEDAVIIPPDDSAALHRALLELIKDQSRRRLLGERAKQTARSLSWEKQVLKIERIYDELIAR
jgi:glycosyltransferase involved in cell wall biosynthesis